MPRVKYTYDGSTATETTANFSGAEETAQDAVDASNQSNYNTNSKQVSRDMADNRRFIMEVI
jgi:hypothetical protein